MKPTPTRPFELYCTLPGQLVEKNLAQLLRCRPEHGGRRLGRAHHHDPMLDQWVRRNKYEQLLRCRTRHHQGCPTLDAMDVLDVLDVLDELKVASIKYVEPTTGGADHGPAREPV